MKDFRDEAIVLHRRNLGETDRFVTFYTKHNGKVTALAKGVRKITSKFGGFLEPLNHLVVEMHHSSRGSHILTGIESKEAFLGLKASPERLKTALSHSEMLLALVPEQEACPALFEDFCACLEYSSDCKDERLLLFKLGFLLKLCSHYHELQPLHRCFHCLEKLTPSDQHCFDLEHLGVICEGCQEAQLSRHHHKLPFDVIKLLHFLQKAPIRDIVHITLEALHIRWMEQIFKDLELTLSS